jgi:hypothetical protein
MRALVVYESYFGNTRDVAVAAAEGLSGVMDVDVTEVGHAPTRWDPDVVLLVVGAPTHAFGLSRPSTRADALRQLSPGTHAPSSTGVREWLERLGAPPGDLTTATFDTRVRSPHVPGSAARAALRRLRSAGFRSIAPPTTFWVEGTAGPLTAGERERAHAWGEELALTVTSSRSTKEGQP